MLGPLITLVIIVAHLFTFRQFSFALIELKNVQSKIQEQEDETSEAPVGFEPVVYEPTDFD